MKYLPLLALLGLLGGYAMADSAISQHPFLVDEFELLSIEYSGPKTVVDIVPYGPTSNEFICGHTGAAAVAQANPNHRYAYTCLHIMFRGPIHNGAVVVQPAGTDESIFEWAAFGIDYALDGSEIGGTRNLKGPFKSADECRADAEDLKRDTYATGAAPSDSTLLIYCVPIPIVTERGGVGDNEA